MLDQKKLGGGGGGGHRIAEITYQKDHLESEKNRACLISSIDFCSFFYNPSRICEESQWRIQGKGPGGTAPHLFFSK